MLKERKMEEKEFVWTTRKGKELKPSEMTDDHLRNALAFVSARLLQLMTMQLSSPVGLVIEPDEIEHFQRAQREFFKELFSRRCKEWEARFLGGEEGAKSTIVDPEALSHFIDPGEEES